MKVKQPSVKQLKQKIIELEAQLAFRIPAAMEALEKASERHMMASACILRITALGGREIVEPVAIRDGLSQESIIALQNDLKRSWVITTIRKPKGVD